MLNAGHSLIIYNIRADFKHIAFKTFETNRVAPMLADFRVIINNTVSYCYQRIY